jgi:hypothetical protein
MKAIRIQAAISEAQNELAKISPQIDTLIEKRNSLQSLIASGQMLLKKPAAPNTPQPQREAWENIAQALQQTQRNMLPKEIVETMERLGMPVRGKFPRDSVRCAMSRRPKIFVKVGQAWGLKAWSAESTEPKQARLQ